MHRQLKRSRELERPPAAPSPRALPPGAERALDVVSRAGLIFFEWTHDQGLTYLSDSARELIGFGPEDFARNRELAKGIIHPDSRAALEAFAEELIESRPARSEVEIRLTTRDGRDLVLEARVVPAFGADGAVTGMSGVAFDATAMVEAREAAAEAEDRYRRIFEDSPTPMWLLNPETREVLEANGQAHALYGYRMGELEGVGYEQLFAANEWEAVSGVLLGAGAEGKLDIVARVMGRRKGGSMFPAEIAVAPLRMGGRKRRLIAVRDLTAAEDAKERLAAKRRALSSGGDPIMILDRGRRVAFSNAPLDAMLGYGPEELLGQEPGSLMAEQAWADEWGRAVEVAELGERWSGWVAFRGADGRPVEAQAEFEPVAGDDGMVTHVVVRLKAGEARPAPPEGEGALYLELMRAHIEDLMAAARGVPQGPGAASGPHSEAARALTSRAAMDQAAEFFHVFSDLSAVRGGEAVPVEAGGAARDINEVVTEAVRRLKPVFGPRDVAVFRKSLTSAPCAHPAIAREALVQLLVEAARAAERGALRLEMVVAAAPSADRPSVEVTIVGPRPLGAGDALTPRVELARRAIGLIGGRLTFAPAPAEGSPHSARFIVTLPCG